MALPGLPSYHDTPELSGGLVPEGRHDFSTRFEFKKSANTHSPMLVVEFIVDNGEHAGASVIDRFVMGGNKQFGEKKLKKFARNARCADGRTDPRPGVGPGGQPCLVEGFEFHGDFDSWEAFTEQFNTNPPLRISAEVKHVYDVETSSGDWMRNIDKEEFDRLTNPEGYIDENGILQEPMRGARKAEINPFSFQPPRAPAEINVVGEATKPAAPQQQPKPQFPTMSGDGAATRPPAPVSDGFGSEDDLPF